MGKHLVYRCGVAALFVCAMAGTVRGEDGPRGPLDALLGTYEGVLEVHMYKTLEYDYRAEIVSVDSAAGTLSLVAHCAKCEIKEWKRNNCKITEAGEERKFTCKGTVSDEEYTVKNGSLRASGQGKKWPYSISAKKVDK